MPARTARSPAAEPPPPARPRPPQLVAQLEGQLCVAQPEMCSNILTAIAGFNSSNTGPQLLPKMLKYTPAGALPLLCCRSPCACVAVADA
jgi:hypothetical protein